MFGERRRHPLLHTSESRDSLAPSPSVPRDRAPSSQAAASNDVMSVRATSNVTSTTNSSRIGLHVVPVRVSTPPRGCIIEAYAFLDIGSNTTMCLSSLAKELEADHTSVEFTLSTVSGNQHREGQQLCLDVVGIATGKGVRLEKV